LTPDAAARIYDGPHFHRSRSPQENRRLIRDQIRRLKASPSMTMRYAGCVLEMISKLPKTLAPQKV
jgi:hypothetical protein